MGLLDPIEELLDGKEDDPMADLATEYRACKQAVVDARQAWATAEAARDVSGIEAAIADMNFSKCCVVAAGEAFKGETFDEVMARHEGSA